MAWIWLAVAVFFLITEAGTVALISAWFSLGALAAMVACLLGAELWLQIVLFLGVAAVALACLRPIVRKYIAPNIVKTNVDSVIGQQGYVTATIDNLSATGQVKLGGMEWSARSENDRSIPVGTLVKVERIEGVKVFVSPVEIKTEV